MASAHLDGKHCDPLWAVDGVPNTQVSSVLCHNYITTRYPLNVRAETQHGALHTTPDVIQVELNMEKETEVTHHSVFNSNIRAKIITFPPYPEFLVPKKQFTPRFIQLQPIYLGVVAYCAQIIPTHQVH